MKGKKNKKTKVKEKEDKKIVKIKKDLQVENTISIKKTKIVTISTFIILFALIIRIGWLQFADGERFKELAYSQQAINQIISPKRGNIYDSTGKALAISEQVDTITINPSRFVKEKQEDTIAYQQLVAQGLSDIFSLDYEETLKKVQSTSSVQTIIRKVEQDKVDNLKKWMEENKIKIGINIDEDSRRYYPYGNLASQLIGFCGSDNQGLSGIEYSWDSVLTGTYGKLVSAKGGGQSEIPNAQEKYIEAEDGSDIILTIDRYIQSIVEKYLKQAVEENNCSKGGNVVVMQPSTGDILAMASYPDYDLNSPFAPVTGLQSTWDTLSDTEQKNALQSVWNSKSISDTYEPGSTFKIITSAVALEEKITDIEVQNDFLCTGVEDVSGTPIRCWARNSTHGYQTLKQAFENSCNPAYMQLGKRIGATTLYRYYEAFGFFDKTGVELSGEYPSLFHKLEKIGPVELATMSFGQRITITPLQLITAVSSIVNDGALMQPRIVKEVINSKTGAVSTVETTKVRQVISKQTAEKMKELLESEVVNGTGGNAKVKGYSVGGKTGTSEPISDKATEGYVASFIGVSPVQNTEVVILLTLYDPPKEKNHQGGQIAAPVVSQMLSEILPYLGIPSNSVDNTEEERKTITLPNVTNKTVTEAKKILTSEGFEVQASVEGNADSLLVKEQVPKAGTQLLTKSIVKLYSTENTTRTSVTVPDLKGMTAEQAINSLKSKNLNININGTGTIISQDYAIGETVEEGTVISVTLNETLAGTY